MLKLWIEGELRIGIRPLPETMKLIAEKMYHSVQQNFLAGGRPPWIAAKAGIGKLLMGSHTLYESIMQNSGEDWAEVWAGTGLPYAMIHQRGGIINHPGSNKFQVFRIDDKLIFTHKTKPHQINIPARPYMVLQVEDWDFIIRELGQGRVTVTTTEGAELLPPL